MSILKVEQKNHILLATVNRPQAKNAVNFELMDSLEAVLDRIEKDEEIRALVLTGEGDHFISGGDLKEFHTLETAEEVKPMARRMLSICRRLEKAPCWTIAAINGAAYGGGCEILLAADFRMAAQTAVFGFTQGKFYLPPGWGGLTRLVERVGRSTALRWLAEASVVDAETAKSCGLIDKIAPRSESLERAVLHWAEELTHNDRAFISNLKKGAIRLAEARWEAINAELDSFARFWEHEKHRHRVEKFLNRKKGARE